MKANKQNFWNIPINSEYPTHLPLSRLKKDFQITILEHHLNIEKKQAKKINKDFFKVTNDSIIYYKTKFTKFVNLLNGFRYRTPNYILSNKVKDIVNDYARWTFQDTAEYNNMQYIEI